MKNVAMTNTVSHSTSVTLAGVPDWVCRRLTDGGQLRDAVRGAVIFREGDLHDQFYILTAGHVALEMCLPGRGCTRLLTVGAGEMLAWSSVVGDARMTATAVAIDDVLMWSISGRELVAMCEADHEFGFHMMRWLSISLSKRLFATRLQLLDMFIADAENASSGSCP